MHTPLPPLRRQLSLSYSRHSEGSGGRGRLGIRIPSIHLFSHTAFQIYDIPRVLHTTPLLRRYFPNFITYTKFQQIMMLPVFPHPIPSQLLSAPPRPLPFM